MYGGTERFQTDPNWKDLLQFFEYFHGDNGAGLGASHQTGWTGLVARVIQARGYLRPEDLLSTALRGNLVYRESGDMSRWSADTVIYELNTAAWLHDVGRRAGRSGPATLTDVPRDEWDAGDSARSRHRVADGRVGAQPSGRTTGAGPRPITWRRSTPRCPISRTSDVIGSAYCIRRYEVDPQFGGRQMALLPRVQRLAERGVRLLVDFVPNHVAPDHPWLTDHPEYFVQGNTRDLDSDPAGFLAVGDSVIACGRDPFFPPWPDVAQLNGSRRGCDKRRPTRCSTSPTRPTGCAATWRCCCSTRCSRGRGEIMSVARQNRSTGLR